VPLHETSSLYCNNNTAIVTVLRLQETLETCPVLSAPALWHGLSSLPRDSPTIRVPPCPHHLHFRHWGHCRSTAARLDFDSSNTPPVEHTLRFQAHLLPSSHRLTSFPVRGSPTVRSTELPLALRLGIR